MNPEIQERIHLLWDELADMDIAHFGAVADRLMSVLCDLVDAQNAAWIGSVRLINARPDDPVKGWRVPMYRFLYPTQLLDEAAREQAKKLNQGMADENTIANIAVAGCFRANRICDLVSEEWFNSLYYQVYYRGVGHSDATYIAFPVNEDAESWFGFYRKLDKPNFTVEERDVLAYVLRGLKWFHRQLMLSHGLLIASAPLTPSERRVLELLLSPAAEKEIARKLGVNLEDIVEQERTVR